MNSSHTIVIRRATAADAETLEQLAILDSRRPLTGVALIAEVDRIPRVALDLNDGSVAADPFAHTAKLVELLKSPLFGAGMQRAGSGSRRQFRAPIAGWSWGRRSVAGLRPSAAR